MPALGGTISEVPPLMIERTRLTRPQSRRMAAENASPIFIGNEHERLVAQPPCRVDGAPSFWCYVSDHGSNLRRRNRPRGG